MRFFDKTYPDIASNLALDEALLLRAAETTGEPLLRIWEPKRLAVVLGASGRLHDDVEVDRCRAEGVEIGRRSSGGGTVLVGPGTLNLTVVLRCDARPEYAAVDTSQIAVLQDLADSFQRAGKDVRVEGSGDLTLGVRKFSGSAQRRLRDWFLIHASILNDAPIEPILRLTKLPQRQPAYRGGRSHDAFLTNLNLPRSTLIQAVCNAWQVSADHPDVLEIPGERIATMVRERFGTPEWIERL